MKIEKYSIGMGDRFAHQGRAQLQAVIQARERGIRLTPVWNKSDREHKIVKSEPVSVREEANDAVAALGWTDSYRVDADHIHLGTVDRFIEASDFFTIDVAHAIGHAAEPAETATFVSAVRKYIGEIGIPGAETGLTLDLVGIENTARKFFGAMQEAGRIYRHIAERKGGDFVAEVSVDETDQPQTPVELFSILAMLAHENVPCQTIAPKFTGRFNKGVDYVGDLARFEKEFSEHLGVVRFAIGEFGLPETLKLSVHSGSDKFSIYPIINRLIKKHGAGLHLKTAGTTWLEEIIGLAEAGGGGLEIAREIYGIAFARFDELVKPYAAVVDVDRQRLPQPAEVKAWSSAEFCAALRHDSSEARYNPHFRQMLHVSFKVAAEMGPRFIDALVAHETIIARNVTANLFDRHIVPLFS